MQSKESFNNNTKRFIDLQLRFTFFSVESFMLQAVAWTKKLLLKTLTKRYNIK